MSSLNHFAKSGYSKGSIIPEKYAKTILADYHPPENSNPKKYRLTSVVSPNRNYVRITVDDKTEWKPAQIEIFKNLQFKLDSSDSSSLISNQSSLITKGFYLHKSKITKVKNSPNGKIYFLETLYWQHQDATGNVDDTFNTFWFWQPN